MKSVIIFGTRENSEILAYYLKNDSDRKVVGFCVDSEYLENLNFSGYPVIAYEEIKDKYSRDEYEIMAPLSPAAMNKKREDLYSRIKKDGFSMGSYISSKALVSTDEIGDNTFILEGNVVQPFVKIGNNVILWCGNHIGHHTEIKNNVMITSHVVISGRCIIGSNSYLAVNSTVRDGVHIADGTFLTMGANLASNTEPWSVYKGEIAIKTKIPSTKMRF